MKQLLLYGDSILMAGLAAHLHDQPTVAVMHLCGPDLLGVAERGSLDTALVDLNTTSPNALLILLAYNPDLRLFGVDAATGVLTALSGRSYPVRSVDDVLAHVLEERPGV